MQRLRSWYLSLYTLSLGSCAGLELAILATEINVTRLNEYQSLVSCVDFSYAITTEVQNLVGA